MINSAIFYPVAVLVLWTLAILLMVGLSRLGAVKKGQVPLSFYRLYRGGEEPDKLAAMGRHFHNLLEVPPLFYLTCIIAYLTQSVSTAMMILAWGFVASRLLHSAIHLGGNKVQARFSVFLIGVLIVVAMWVLILLHL
ncbi:hypothetical protein GCM10007972_07590 [Iodidimonas muriae]|uniref:MAPEG family protein n=1 Tax=Iodidimonas muriae TaxID=261467 RepID=A0ABQ2L9K8_9PROT|nr:MAPEG family protein [Iodidimonas muriae]GER06013.1 hypothetical protein JCM17843_03230 [Kordiimonadales bacterium JCM 17843]GGO07834.1 hypothetical protein GCM10007972_07590 [Iodidimonas muriae]